MSHRLAAPIKKRTATPYFPFYSTQNGLMKFYPLYLHYRHYYVWRSGKSKILSRYILRLAKPTAQNHVRKGVPFFQYIFNISLIFFLKRSKYFKQAEIKFLNIPFSSHFGQFRSIWNVLNFWKAKPLNWNIVKWCQNKISCPRSSSLDKIRGWKLPL